MLKIHALILVTATSFVLLSNATFKPLYFWQFTALAAGECTGLRIESPNYDSGKDEPLVLKALIDGIEKDGKLEYIWTVSRGSIKTGQGTPSITLEVEHKRASLVVEVEIKGLPDGCPGKTTFYVDHY